MSRLPFLFVLGLLMCFSAAAQDPAKVDAKHCKVELDNAKVRVLRWHVGPHETIPMHSHPANLTIFLNDQHAMYTLPDGKKEESKQKAGAFTWSPAGKHATEILSDTPIEVIQIELK